MNSCWVSRQLAAPGLSGQRFCFSGLMSLINAVDQDFYPAWPQTTPCSGDGDKKFRVYASSDFAGNRGISIITTSARAEAMLLLPGFQDPQAVAATNFNEQQQYQVEEIPGKGIGLIAIKPLWRGDRILSNTASTMVDYKTFETLPSEEVVALEIAMLASLPISHQHMWMNLSIHEDTILSDGDRIVKIMSTNAFDVNIETEGYPFFFTTFPEGVYRPM